MHFAGQFVTKKLLLRSAVFALGLSFFAAPNFAQADITFVGSASTTGNSASVSVSLTSLVGGAAGSAAAGDLVIVIDAFAGTADLDAGVSTSGYVETAELYTSDQSDDTNLSVNYKVMDASPDTSVTCNGSGTATNGTTCIVYVWRGVDQITPLDVATVTVTPGNNPSSSIPNPAAITPTTAGSTVIAIGAGADAAADLSVTQPTGYSNHAQSSVDPGIAIIAAAASKAWSGSGAEDPAVWTNWTSTTAGSWAAVTLALRPAVAPTVTSDAATSVTFSSATIGGNITATGGASSTIRGFATSTASDLSSSVSTTTESGSFDTGAWTASFSNTALAGNTTYYYRAYATNPAGTGYGSIANFLTLPDTPGTPSIGSVTATTTSVTWTAPTGGASSYKLQYCNGACVLSTGLAGLSTTTNPLVGNTTYSFAVRGTNATGDGVFSASSTQLTLPDVPGTPTFSAVTASAMRISWTAPSGGATTYKLERCSGSGCTNYAEIAAAVATTFYDDSSLAESTTYRYRVRATNATGDGLYSTGAEQATTGSNPTVTTDTTSAIVATSSTLNGTITDTGGTNATTRGFATSTDSALGSGVSTSTESGSFGVGAFTGSNTGLTGNTTYYVRAYATNPGGTSYGSIANFLTPPDIPTSILFSNTTATTTDVSWTAPAGGATTYKLLWCTSGGSCSASVGISGVSTTTYSLSANTAYTFKVLGTNATGDGYYTASSSMTTLTDAPGTPTYTDTVATSTGITWTASAGASSYKLEQCQGATCSLFAGITSNATTTYSLTGNTTYSYAARATNATGDSLFSATSTILTAPNIPTSVIFSNVTATTTNVSWTAPTGGATTYKLDVCAGAVCNLYTNISGVSTTTYGLAGNTTYDYSVRGTNATGDGLQTATSTQLTVPAIPGTPTFSAVTASAMRISWTAPSGGATTYKLERCSGAGCSDYSSLATGVTGLFYDDSGLTQSTTYRYRVRATNATGDGAYSAGAEQATAANPPTVTTQAASSVTATAATLNGNITATGGANATVRGFAYSTNSTLSSSVSTTTNNGDYGTGAFTENISSLTGNTTYYFRPYATNSGGTSYGSIELFLTYPGAPDGPSYDSTTATTTGVSWGEAAGGASSYELTQCQGATCSVFANVLSAATTTYSLSGNTTYSYAARGFNATGYGAFSATTTRLMVPEIPGTPSFSAVLGTSLTVSWSGSVGSSSSYKIERCAGSGCSNYASVATGLGTTTYNDSGLSGGTTYRYRVRATNATGDGVYSAGAEQTTAAVAATVTTGTATEITTTGAILGGEITATGGADATTRGFAWGTSPTLGAGTATTSEGGSFGTGTFESTLSSLSSSETYYFRAYATNSAGTSVGAIVSFATAAISRGGGGGIGDDAPPGQGIVGGGEANGGLSIGNDAPPGQGIVGGGGGGGGGEI